MERTDQDYDDMMRAIVAIERGQAQQIRERAGISSVELARRIGVTYVAVRYWERGARLPQGDNAVAYGRELRKLSE